MLGLVWNNKDDVLKYKVEVKVSQQSKLTKRNICSQVARIYDPIGFAAPYLVRAKIGFARFMEREKVLTGMMSCHQVFKRNGKSILQRCSS